MTEIQLLRAYDALQDIKMFMRLNERQREGVQIAQSVVMQQLSALKSEGKPCTKTELN